MQLEGPCRYLLTLTHEPLAFTVRCPNGTPRFAGLASRRVSKLYVVTGEVESVSQPVYVGVTRQTMQKRFRYGWDADGGTGYHGYKWRHTLQTAVVDVWAASEEGEAVTLDIETVEAELVFLIRDRLGQWPLFQNEIHFHPSEERHRRAAAHVFARYAEGEPSTISAAAAPLLPALPPEPVRVARPSGKTTAGGYENRNAQKNMRALGLPGTDHGQSLYEMLCLDCGHQYAANGSDIHQRKCPQCQGGRPSTGDWRP